MNQKVFQPLQTSTPKRLSFLSRSSLSTNDYNEGCSSDSESSSEVHKIYLPRPTKIQKIPQKPTHTISTQTDTPMTHSVKTQAAPMMITARVQTSPDKVKYYLKPRENDTGNHIKTGIDTGSEYSYGPAQRIREAARRPRKEPQVPEKALRAVNNFREEDFSRLQGQLEEKRNDIRALRQMIREKDEALARQSQDLKMAQRELARSERDAKKSRNFPTPTPIAEEGHDLKINLKEGSDADAYGQIQQVRPGQIQELKTIRKVVKNLNGLPVKYSTKVSVKCQKVAVFF